MTVFARLAMLAKFAKFARLAKLAKLAKLASPSLSVGLLGFGFSQVTPGLGLAFTGLYFFLISILMVYLL